MTNDPGNICMSIGDADRNRGLPADVPGFFRSAVAIA